jgi:hypothetical protein
MEDHIHTSTLSLPIKRNRYGKIDTYALKEMCINRGLSFQDLEFVGYTDRKKFIAIIYMYDALKEKFPDFGKEKAQEICKAEGIEFRRLEEAVYELYHKVVLKIQPIVIDRRRNFEDFKPQLWATLLYVAAYHANSMDKPVWACEVLSWISSNKLSFFTVHKEIAVNSLYQSYFKPNSAYTINTIKKQILKIQRMGIDMKFEELKNYWPFVKLNIEKCCLILGIPEDAERVIFKIYHFCQNVLEKYDSSIEYLISACIIIFLKLLFGLNDRPSIFDCTRIGILDIDTQNALWKLEGDLIQIYKSLPSLGELFEVILK